MRYLKVTVQDRTGNGRADSVLLQFYEAACTPGDDILLNKAFALDFDADGNVDYKMGDVTNNGVENNADQRLLKTFANACLKLNWFNPGGLHHTLSENVRRGLRQGWQPGYRTAALSRRHRKTD